MENGEIPENANENCPGPQSESAGTSDACQGCPNQEACASAPKGPDPDLIAIAEWMATVKHKIFILSRKGGVGKSTFSAQISFAPATMDFQVGLLDIDICGPSIPKMFGLKGQDIHQSNLGWSPVYVESNLGVMSIGFMLPNPDEAVIWRGPIRMATGIDGAIIVTTPQQVSLIDVHKEVNFCQKVRVEVLGVVENMSGLCQPLMDFRFMKLTETREQQDVTEREMGVPFLGKIPLDPQL
ncbi:hypothetical protein GH714_041813 [Hevea brasiliensis]|uniref:Cytosolic Fe-S cluster assembly factor NBP35 n=1 Tax=Hevea brasiliensis TaxID=3981 RepID=A0A6A6MRE5_HEVBR|nr:hypothetical protein GH714_041813 [Hevea brasiliensis]